MLFIIEGFPSVLVAVWAWYWIPDSPASTPWLNARERKVATLRMRKKLQVEIAHGHLDWTQVRKTLSDPKSYLTAAIFFSCNVAFSSMPVFEPIIVKSIGYPPVVAQGLSALPHLFAFVVVLVVAITSDRLRTRSYPIMTVALMAMSGYILLALAESLNLAHVLRYMCLFPITAGFFSAVTLTITWTLDNQQSDEGKGTGVAMLNYIGQLGPFVGTGLYPARDAPYYTMGHAVCACFMGLIVVLTVVLRKLLVRENGTAASTAMYARVDDHEEGEDSDERGRELVEKTPMFLYIL